MPNEYKLLWDFYQEHCEWERHHEQQRALVTSTLLAITAGILSVITFDGHISHSDLPLSLFLIILGLFGSIFSLKHYERFCQHKERADEYRKELDQEYPSLNILTIRHRADEITKKKFSHLGKFRLHYFWVGVHIAIILFGLLLTIGIWMNWYL